ncbi:MAG: carboxypeptidase regulatory-like domain-containing protein, partial [Acidobacteria bacterium]|nr:carboxypeptidase regulatory-like domain-containing protein [Acidobacteriota bacterium]
MERSEGLLFRSLVLTERGFRMAFLWPRRAGLLAAAISLAAYAQQSSGSIRGTVRDSGGGVVPGAKVVLVDTAQGDNREVVTNQEGVFFFNPHFRFEPRVRISRMLVRINIHRGLKAAKTPAEDSTQWVTNKTSPFSSRSTAFSRSTSRDRALL